MKGSVTLEASFVSVLTTVVLAALILGAFYEHDRCVLEETAIEMELRGIYDRDDAASLTEILKSRLAARLLMSSVETAAVTESGRKITVSASAVFRPGTYQILGALVPDGGRFSYAGSGQKPPDAEELLRAAHGLIWRDE